MPYSSLIITLLLIMLAFLAVVYWRSKKQQTQAELKVQSLKQEIQNLHQQQQQLDHAKADAESANQAKNRYLSGISHELRTPLNVIMGYAQLLENQTDEVDKNKTTYALMRHNCEHLAHLIDGILEFSAIESGRLKVQFELFDLKELIQQLNMMFKTQAEKNGLEFITNQAANLPQTVKSDHKRIQQILINLLSNAIKFTEQGHVAFNISYRNQVVTFTIKDTGCGIDSSDLTRIFEPFERIEQSHKPIKGTGLGLPITQLLVELLGGELTVNSEVNQGSEFVFKIMLSAQAKAPKSSTLNKNNNHKQHQILVVDDEASHRMLIHDMLTPHGFQVLLAESGVVTQKLMATSAIDLVILDVAMPGMDGWQLATWIRGQHPTTKIMMLSANPRDMESHTHRPHDAYLTKPVKINQLLSQLNQLLDLGWTQQAQNQPQSGKPQPVKLEQEQQTALLNMADIGHINGIESYLEHMHANKQIDDNQYRQLTQPIKHMNLDTFKQMISHGHN